LFWLGPRWGGGTGKAQIFPAKRKACKIVLLKLGGTRFVAGNKELGRNRAKLTDERPNKVAPIWGGGGKICSDDQLAKTERGRKSRSKEHNLRVGVKGAQNVVGGHNRLEGWW